MTEADQPSGPFGPPSRVISGGQTGVDRAALDAARACTIPSGGWCPAGRWAEDGPIPRRYPLEETATADPACRTRLNVEEADGTLILIDGRWDDGTRLTEDAARDLGRPLLVVDLAALPEAEARARIVGWLADEGIRSLNVAGPRESTAPGIYRRSRGVLTSVFAARGRRS